MTKYTYTFKREEEKKFRNILSRLEPEEYVVIEDIKPVDEKDRYSDLQTIMEMDSESALTFRMGMKEVKIRRERTEEELAKEKEIEERHKVTITVVMPSNTNSPESEK